MKIGVAQIKPGKGNIQENIEIHKSWIEIAFSENVDLIVFPELSITGYEPELAKELAVERSDSRLDVFREISNLYSISIALGIPTQSDLGTLISMFIFQPNEIPKIYSKQKLPSDESTYFVAGNKQLIFTVGNKKIAPAICYESLQDDHADHAKKLGAEIYLASVAKSQDGIDRAFTHYPKIAKVFSMPVLMSNSIGSCDHLLSVGQSAIWNDKGKLLGKLESDNEGLLVFDTETEEVTQKTTFRTV